MVGHQESMPNSPHPFPDRQRPAPPKHHESHQGVQGRFEGDEEDHRAALVLELFSPPL